MMNRENKIHRVAVGAVQPVVLPRRGTLALRKSRLVRRRIRTGFYVIGFTLSLAAVSHASFGFLMETSYFQIKEVRIEGVSVPLREEIKGLVDNMTSDHLNILGIDASELQEQISRHPRIRDLRLDKIYPDQLLIRAVERQEVAILATPKGMFLADEEGYAMEKLDTEYLAKADLPYISGLRTEEVHAGEPVDSASLDKALTLIQVLKERNVALYEKISEVEIQTDEVSPLETLTAHMKGGLDIRFGDSNPVDKLPELETLLRKFQANNVEPFESLVYIDLRFANSAFYMDRETALLVEQDPSRYDEFEQAVAKEAENYERQQERESEKESRAVSSKRSASSSSERESSSRSASQNSSAQSRSRNTRQQYQQGYQPYQYQNYQQNAQQYYQQQYYQQRQYTPAQQYPSRYNRPANQQRY